MALHARYGGVVPELASREHVTSIVPVINEALAPIEGGWDAIDAVACTYGPGLASALLCGVNAAKGLAWARGKPLVAVNHIEGHIYAAWLAPAGETIPEPPAFPVVALVVSGGHTTLVLMRDHGVYELLGQTRDDAAGEAFDKTARILGLGYPGGPRIQQVAANVERTGTKVPRAWLRDSYDFSFSGVKTHVLHEAQRQVALHGSAGLLATVDPGAAGQLAAAFQESVVDVLVEKTVAAAKAYHAATVVLAGGVAANTLLRATLIARSTVPVHCPPIALCTDNAAMIGAAASYRYAHGLQHDWSLAVIPNLRLV
ncbi:MAG: tRNA (adenosine(37)-N6)-threonylcarbamoyltransferase complex transferase subunit TsaD [Herpetosiphon sp.]